jgi:phage/plasmid-like protein (TIGR03299 family)
MLAAANLDWEVEQRPVFYESATSDLQTTDYRANVRADNGFLLGIVSGQYRVLQNREAFDFLDKLWQDEVLQYEAAFSLRGGKRVCILGRLPKSDEIVDGDEMLRYVLLSTAHDGTGGVQIGPTAVRVVCANTYALAVGASGSKIRSLSIRHSANLDNKLRDARRLLGIANGAFDRHTDECRKLAAQPITLEQWRDYLDDVCPIPLRTDPAWTQRRENAVVETRTAITAIYNTAPQLEGVRGTYWGAYNAISQHVDHLPRKGTDSRGRSEARFCVTQEGTGRDIKAYAFSRALAAVG